MKEIPLTQGKVALVDDADYERLSHWRSWQAVCRYGRWWYAQASLDNRPVALHRIILDAPPGVHVDHINGDGLDNRRANLRLCTHAENMRNRRKMTTRPTTSKYKGVSFSKRHKSTPWTVIFHGKYCGRYSTETEAARVWNERARATYGEFANLNQVD